MSFLYNLCAIKNNNNAIVIDSNIAIINGTSRVKKPKVCININSNINNKIPFLPSIFNKSYLIFILFNKHTSANITNVVNKCTTIYVGLMLHLLSVKWGDSPADKTDEPLFHGTKVFILYVVIII